MTYIKIDRHADMSVSVHPYTGISGTSFTYSTPSDVGDGVARTHTSQFTLAAGRHYILFGGWALKRTGTITYVDVSAQWHDGTQYIGKKGSIRLSSGSTNASDTKLGLHRNPTYRREAVAFVPSSSIIGSQTYTLERISVVDGNGGGNWSYANASNCNAAIIIMSIPA